jgi:hypothetical protein
MPALHVFESGFFPPAAEKDAFITYALHRMAGFPLRDSW